MLKRHGEGSALHSRTGDFSCGQTGAQISCVPADLRGGGINDHSAKFVQLSGWGGDDDAGSVGGHGELSRQLAKENLQAGG